MRSDKKDFNDKNFAELYIKKHKKIIEKLGYSYAKKLASIGFKKGKILDVPSAYLVAASLITLKHKGKPYRFIPRVI